MARTRSARRRRFAEFNHDDDDDEGYVPYDRIKNEVVTGLGLPDDSKKPKYYDTNPQLSSLHKNAPHYDSCLPLPYELLIKIFHNLVEVSDHPIIDLCSLAQVCETWRIIVITSPSLWSRIHFQRLPITDGNLKVLRDLINSMPTVMNHLNEIALKGDLRLKESRSLTFLEDLIMAPNLGRIFIDDLEAHSKATSMLAISRAMAQCRKLTHLSIRNTRILFGNQKWLADHLVSFGNQLEELHLTSSLTSISSQLFRAIAADYCPQLRVLDISTCDSLNTRSFNAIQLSQNMPNLVILRVANVSFRRILANEVQIGKMAHLEELSMPIGMRDADRDDALLTTLAYRSEKLTTLDLRGSSMSAYALISLPSYNVKELHVDDICPLTRQNYWEFIKKWRHSLEVLSLVKINCSETVKTCLDTLIGPQKKTFIKELDLASSDVTTEDLSNFLRAATALQTINLSSCRSLPRGCKGKYTLTKTDDAQLISDLRRKLGCTASESETEVDEAYDQRPRKRRRTRKRQPEYIFEY